MCAEDVIQNIKSEIYNFEKLPQKKPIVTFLIKKYMKTIRKRNRPKLFGQK